MKKILSLGVMFLTLLVLSTVALAADPRIEILDVELDSKPLNEVGSNPVSFKRNQDNLEVQVHFRSNVDNNNIQVEAFMRGHDQSNEIVGDLSDVFRVRKNIDYYKDLTIDIPSRMEQSNFVLFVRVYARNGQIASQDYQIRVEAESHEIRIKDVVLNPENEIRAGRTLLASLRLKNMGVNDEEGVKVRVSIPELGISASDFVNEIEAESDSSDNDQATSNELFLRIPRDAETGVYTVVAEALFRDLDEKVSYETEIRVIGEEQAAPTTQEKTVIIVPTERQALTAGGSELFYPITITNMGSESKAYTLTVDALAWGTGRVSPSNFDVVNAGDSKTFNVHVAASASAPAGEQTFLVTIKSGDKVLKQIPLKSVISGKTSVSGGFSLKTVLEVLAVVLVVLIIIILLVFGLSRVTRRDDDDEDKEDEAYY
tara:strand:+ start:28311 stop:29597 length:1287 start_codon:yes stop_codon:yes gene_type:complete